MSGRSPGTASPRRVRGKPAPKRGQGRPPQADADLRRANILAATRVLLKERSPAKITRFDIGRAAKVDPALIRYYFGDKSMLFREVIRECIDDLRRRRNALPAGGTTAEKLRARLKVWLDFFSETPHFHELVIEEVFFGEANEARDLLSQFVQRVYPDLEALVKTGIREGDLRSVEPRFVYIALIALCEFFVTAAPLVEELFGVDRMDKRLIGSYGDFAADLLVEGLKRR